jgi:hypothetical protein
VWKGASAGRRRQHHGVVGGRELDRTGQEVGMQVSVGGVGDLEPVPSSDFAKRSQVARGIDRQRSTVTRIDEVRTVAEPLIDQRLDRHPGDTHSGFAAITST